jgi:hypothetical protein
MWFDAHAELAAIRARAQARIDSLPTEALAPDGVTVTTKVTQIEICAPETETIPAVTYLLVIDDEGVLHITDGCGYGVPMSPAAARAIGAELIRMGGE